MVSIPILDVQTLVRLSQSFSFPFGAFFSCVAGNILTCKNVSEFLSNPSDWPMCCPPGFTQHLAMIEKNCPVNFCIKAGSLRKHNDLHIVLPPLEPKPDVRSNATGLLFKNGLRKVLMQSVLPTPQLPIPQELDFQLWALDLYGTDILLVNMGHCQIGEYFSV